MRPAQDGIVHSPIQGPDSYSREVYTVGMDELSPVRQARHIFLIIVAIRVILLLIPFLLPLPFTLDVPFVTGRLLLVGALSFVGLASSIPRAPARFQRFSLAFALAFDILIMNLGNASHMYLAQEMATFGLKIAYVPRMTEPFLYVLFPLVLLAWAFGKGGAIWGIIWGLLTHAGAVMALQWLGYVDNTFWVDLLARSVFMLLLAVMVATLAERQRMQMAELREAQERLQRHAVTVERLAVSRERNRLARDMHDTLSHSLAALAVQLEALRSVQHGAAERIEMLTADDGANEVLDEAKQLADSALQLARDGLEEARQAIRAVRTDPLASVGLIGATQDELRAFEARTGVRAELAVLGETADLSQMEESVLYRNLQEALRNVERHADAEHVWVRLAFAEDGIALFVEDDGVGFDATGDDSDGYGILGMRERAAMVDGELLVGNGPRGGTQVHCRIPR